MKPFLIGLGALLLVVGALWFLQGIGVVGGSFMSGNTTWAIIGPIVALIGVALAGFTLRRR